MQPNERGKLFKHLRRLHGVNVDSGLNDLTEAFASFVTRARYFSIGHLRRTWSHSAVEFMKYRRRLPQILADNESNNEPLSNVGSSNKENSPSEFNIEALNSRRVYVSNVPAKVTTTQLASFFAKFGKVVSCSVPVDRPTATLPRRSRGNAYITFKTNDEAEKAKTAPPAELTLYDRTMVVTQAVKLPKKRHSEHWTTDRNVPLAQSEDSEGVVSESEHEQASTPCSPILMIAATKPFPNRVLLRTFRYLGLFDRVRVERVCKQWQELSFESWSDTKELSFSIMSTVFRNRPLQNSTFKSILHRCGPHLMSLDLSGSSHFLNDYSLTLITESCPKLKCINLTGVKVDWKALKLFAESIGPQLETIVYRDAYFLSEKAFWWLLRFCSNLKTIDLGSCVRLSGRCFRLMGDSLESVRLDGCRKLHPSAIEELCLKSTGLKRLNIDECSKLTDATLSLISRSLENLEMFSMSNGPFAGVTAVGLCQLGRLINLNEIHLDRNVAVDDSVLRTIADSCAHVLRCLTLSQAGDNENLTQYGLLQLKTCEKLKELDVSYLTAITDASIEKLTEHVADLEIVRVRACRYLGDKGVEALSKNCSNLQEVDVSGCVSVTNRSLQMFFDTPRLATMTLTFGGTSGDAQKLFRALEMSTMSKRIVLDTMDSCQAHLRPGFESRLSAGSVAADDDEDEDELGDDDEFESLTAQRSFVLDALDEDDFLSAAEEEELDNEMPLS